MSESEGIMNEQPSVVKYFGNDVTFSHSQYCFSFPNGFHPQAMTEFFPYLHKKGGITYCLRKYQHSFTHLQGVRTHRAFNLSNELRKQSKQLGDRVEQKVTFISLYQPD